MSMSVPNANLGNNGLNPVQYQKSAICQNGELLLNPANPAGARQTVLGLIDKGIIKVDGMTKDQVFKEIMGGLNEAKANDRTSVVLSDYIDYTVRDPKGLAMLGTAAPDLDNPFQDINKKSGVIDQSGEILLNPDKPIAARELVMGLIKQGTINVQDMTKDQVFSAVTGGLKAAKDNGQTSVVLSDYVDYTVKDPKGLSRRVATAPPEQDDPFLDMTDKALKDRIGSMIGPMIPRNLGDLH